MKEIKVERTLNGRGKQDRPLPLFIDLHRLSQSMFREEIGRLPEPSALVSPQRFSIFAQSRGTSAFGVFLEESRR